MPNHISAMTLPVIILGAGGHAKVLIDTLQKESVPVIGITDLNQVKVGNMILGVPVISGDDALSAYAPENIRLVNGLASVESTSQRTRVYETFKERGYRFASVIHPSAIIASDVHLGEGVQIMAGAVIQPGSHVGENTIVNTNATIEHDCRIGAHVHIAPGVTLSGNVCISDRVHLGLSATVVQGIRIGAAAVIAAGAVVVTDVPPGAKVMGVPARVKEQL
jgi:UDP-perosamine 4-acetyltransferase